MPCLLHASSGCCSSPYHSHASRLVLSCLGLSCSLQELDSAHKDNKCNNFPDDFTCETYFQPEADPNSVFGCSLEHIMRMQEVCIRAEIVATNAQLLNFLCLLLV